MTFSESGIQIDASDHLKVRRGFFGKLDTDKIMDKGILIDQMT
jgi:hypothetical protein